VNFKNIKHDEHLKFWIKILRAINFKHSLWMKLLKFGVKSSAIGSAFSISFHLVYCSKYLSKYCSRHWQLWFCSYTFLKSLLQRRGERRGIDRWKTMRCMMIDEVCQGWQWPIGWISIQIISVCILYICNVISRIQGGILSKWAKIAKNLNNSFVNFFLRLDEVKL